MTTKHEPAFVADGRSVTTLRGIAHAGAKIKWSDLDGKNEQAKKLLFTKLLTDGFLEPVKTQADKFNEDLAGQIGFGEETGEEGSGEEGSGEESPGEDSEKDFEGFQDVLDGANEKADGSAPGDEAPEKSAKPTRKQGAQRKK